MGVKIYKYFKTNLKILQISASYKPAYIYGGPVMSVAKLSEQLTTSGNQVEVFTTTANGTTELPVIKNKPQNVDGVGVRYFDRITKDHSHFSPRLLTTLWKEVQSHDIVHIHAWWNLVSVLSCFIALIKKVPVVVSPRGTLSHYSFNNNHVSIKKLIHKFIGRPLLNRCFIHTTSQREHTAIAELLQPKAIFTMPNFVSLPHQTKANEHGYGILRLLFFSRIEKKKGLELLFNALANTTIPYRLTIAGIGDERYITKLKQLSREYQINNKIDWVGFKSNDKFEIIAAHDLLVLPSYDENFANVVIESLSAGTAVLISENVGLADYVAKKNAGWICELDPKNIAGILREVYYNKDVLAQIRRDIPAVIYQDFDEDNLAKQYFNMYNQVNN